MLILPVKFVYMGVLWDIVRDVKTLLCVLTAVISTCRGLFV